MSRVDVVVVAAALLAGCTHQLPPKPVSRLDVLVGQLCIPCHEGEPDRPDLRSSSRWSRTLTLQAALMVGAGEMPPRTSLPEMKRRELVAELCAAAEPNPAICMASFAPPRPTTFVRSPAEFLRAADVVVPHTVTDAPVNQPAQSSPPSAEALLRKVFPPDVRTVQYVPTVQLLVALIAAERCSAAEPAQSAAYDRCLLRILDPPLLRLPPPPQEGR